MRSKTGRAQALMAICLQGVQVGTAQHHCALCSLADQDSDPSTPYITPHCPSMNISFGIHLVQ